MTSIANLAIKLLGTAIGFAIIIATIYVWILPTLFNGYKTYSFLVIGSICSAVLSSYWCYISTNENISPIARYVICSFGGIIVAALVVIFSLFIILNVRGS